MKRKIWILVGIGLMCLSAIDSSMAQGAAQGTTPLALKNDVWAVNYRVSVMGEFKKEPEIGKDGPTVYYHINREYDGKANLVFAPRPDQPQSAARFPTFKDPAAAVHIKISDFWNTIFDPVCGDFQTIEESWSGEVWSAFGNTSMPKPALLLVNNDKLSYKISLPLLYTPTANTSDIAHLRQEIEHLHTRETKVKSSTSSRESIAAHSAPPIKGVLESWGILHSLDWSKLNVQGNEFSWTSDVMHPDEPLIEGIPESKDQVGIVIVYSFKKVNL